jgi:hypothetical protein
MEPTTRRYVLNMDKENPIFWIALGGGIAVMGFLMLDRYVPRFGIVWNIMNGMVFGGVPYRYVLIGAIGCIFYGVYLWNKTRLDPNFTAPINSRAEAIAKKNELTTTPPASVTKLITPKYVDNYMDHVMLFGQRVERPVYVSRSSWLWLWENVAPTINKQ